MHELGFKIDILFATTIKEVSTIKRDETNESSSTFLG